MKQKTPADLRRDADHIWHCWLNSRNKPGAFDHSMYEFKSMLDFLGWGHKRLADAFTGNLPKTHRQCSRCESEPIPENKLRCCLGAEVTHCEILVSIKEKFDEERGRTCGELGNWYAGVPDSEMYRIMANTCAWHIMTEQLVKKRFIDTSEGHLMDESDRMFWSRVYESMAATDDGGAQ